MKTFGEIRNLVLLNVGDNSSEVIKLAKDAINQSHIIGALTFNPIELNDNITYSLSIGDDTIDLSTSTFSNLLVIKTMYDTTNSNKIWYITPERWDFILPTALTAIKYYTIFGQTLYLVETSGITTTTNIEIKAIKYPTLLVSDENELSYDNHDSFIIATATSLVFAAMEEADSATMWQTAATSLATSLGYGLTRRLELNNARKLISSNDVSS